MLLCIGDLLKPINIFCKQLQLRRFQFTSVKSYVNNLFSKLERYKTECDDEKYYFGSKASEFLVFCKERMVLARMLRKGTLVEDAKNEIKKFKDSLCR